MHNGGSETDGYRRTTAVTALAGMILTVVGLVLGGGIVHGTFQTRLTAVELLANRSAEHLVDVEKTMIRIETKLDQILEQVGGPRVKR